MGFIKILRWYWANINGAGKISRRIKQDHGFIITFVPTDTN